MVLHIIHFSNLHKDHLYQISLSSLLGVWRYYGMSALIKSSPNFSKLFVILLFLIEPLTKDTVLHMTTTYHPEAIFIDSISQMKLVSLFHRAQVIHQYISHWDALPAFGDCQSFHLEKETATHSSILACRIQWTEEAGGLLSMGSQRVQHDWENNTHILSIYAFSFRRHMVGK